MLSRPTRTMHTKKLAAAVAASLFVMPAGMVHAADTLPMTLTDTGQREYYCQAMFEMTVPADAAYQDINGYFYVFVGDEQVGRSKGSSFRFNEGQNTATATFETPNAPCGDVDGYIFVVGACMQDGSFTDRHACAAEIAPGGVVKQVRAR